MLGSYGCKVAPETFVERRSEAIPTERMDLAGKRFVAATELSEGSRLAETFIKEATGEDPIRGRRLHQNTWQFEPQHHIFLATNYKPEIRGTNHAIWRRIKLVPFVVTISDEEKDKKLMEKLKRLV